MKKRLDEEQVTFTAHQLLILELWAENTNLEQVATQMGLSLHTVHTHLKRMRKKLGVGRTFELWKYAQQQGWLE